MKSVQLRGTKMKQMMTCLNCNGSGRVSAGMWLDETESDNLMHKFETCPICKGEGTVELGGGNGYGK